MSVMYIYLFSWRLSFHVSNMLELEALMARDEACARVCQDLLGPETNFKDVLVINK